MKKRYSIISLFLVIVMTLIFAGGCAGLVPAPSPDPSDTDNPPSEPTPEPNPEPEPDNGERLAARICTTSSGKTYVEVDGKPFSIVGGQVRVDGLYNRSDEFRSQCPPCTDDEVEQYFAKAAECGLNTLELALQWKDVEQTKDNYDFSLVDKLLTFAVKYNLKCEFLWFSTNMCGDGHGFSVPEYIVLDQITYPRLQAEGLYFSHMYGQLMYFVLDNPNLMQRESLALTKLMDYVYEWSNSYDKATPLIGVQIHNESDGLLRWRLEQKKLSLDGEGVSPERLWQMTLAALDNAGKAVKQSKYKVYTRCNMTVTLGTGAFPQFSNKTFSPLDVLALDGIDIVGDDPYVQSPEAISKTIKSYSVNGNYPHIAENMGNYDNSPSLFLAAYQAGGCYMFYDFATPQYFILINGSSSYQMDQGLLNPDFSFKPHTQQTLDMVKGITSMGSVLPLVDSADFVAFNIDTQYPQQKKQQTLATTKPVVTFSTENGSIGFAVWYDGCLYLYFTADCSVTVSEVKTQLVADIGAFCGDEFVATDKQYITDVIEVSANKLYRLKIRKD